MKISSETLLEIVVAFMSEYIQNNYFKFGPYNEISISPNLEIKVGNFINQINKEELLKMLTEYCHFYRIKDLEKYIVKRKILYENNTKVFSELITYIHYHKKNLFKKGEIFCESDAILKNFEKGKKNVCS